MKAVIFHEFGGPDKLVYEDVAEPTIGKDEVLVRVKACSINHLDIWVRGGIPAYKISLPHISGCDVAGIVEKTGEGVQNINAGERVIIAPGLSCFRCSYCLSGHDNLCTSYRIIGAGTDGGYAEYTKAPARNIISIPERLSFEEAAAFPLVFLTAWHMLITRCSLRPGQAVLVHAAGSGVGSAAIQVARLAGAKVIATAGSDEKLEKAVKIGAEHVINYTKEDFSKRAHELTAGRGVDIVFEHVGPQTWEKSILSLAKNGKIVTCGATSGPEAKTDLRYIFSRQLTILGSIMGTRGELIEITRLMGDGKLKAVIDSVHPLKEARKAQELMLSRGIFGKLILVT